MGVSLNKRLFVRTLLLISTGKTSREEHLALWNTVVYSSAAVGFWRSFHRSSSPRGRQRAACGVELTWWKMQRGHLSVMHFPASRHSLRRWTFLPLPQG